MRFLILGATGMAGHMVALYLCERGYEVTGTARRPASFLEERGVGVAPLDVTDAMALQRIVASGVYDVVVNCIGLLNRDCDARPDSAVYLNSYLPHALVQLTAGMRTRVFHMSTDCVFAGNTGPYTEDSLPDGVTMYDRSKALGEFNNKKDLVLRQSIVGPDVNPNGMGLLNWFMAQKGPVKGFASAIWTGLTTLELAKAIEACAVDGSAGLVNMVPEGSINKCDLLRLFDERLRGGLVGVVSDDELRLDKTLVRTNFRSSFRPGTYEEQVREMARWIRAHKELYPHYEVI